MTIPDRFLFHQSNGAVLFIYDWQTVLVRLSYFGHKGPEYLIIELEDGSYIQCAGVKKRLTVETRIYREGKRFAHRVWGKEAATGVRETVQSSGGIIWIDSSQALTMRDARLLVLAFLEGEPVPSRYIQTDISARFAPVPDDVAIRHKAWNWPDRRTKTV